MKTASIEEFYKLQITAEMCGFNASSFEEYLKELEQDCNLSYLKHQKQTSHTNVPKTNIDLLELSPIRKNVHERVPKSADEILNKIKEIEKKQINKSKFNS